MPSTLWLALAVGLTGLFFVLAAAALAPDSVMQLLPWRANEAFLPSNATDVARGCSGVDTVPDFSFERCVVAIGCAARPHSTTHGLRLVRQTSERGSHRSICVNSVGQSLLYCLLPTASCDIWRPSMAVQGVCFLPVGSKVIGITSHGCTREGPRSQPSRARSGDSARQPSSRPQDTGAGQLTGSSPSDMRPGSLPQVLLYCFCNLLIRKNDRTSKRSGILCRAVGVGHAQFHADRAVLQHAPQQMRRLCCARLSVGLSRPSVPAEGRAHDNDFHDSVVLGAGRTPDTAQAARMQVRLDTGHVLPVSLGLIYRACSNRHLSLCVGSLYADMRLMASCPSTSSVRFWLRDAGKILYSLFVTVPQLWVVSTDYSNWALVCTTSVSLGGGQPAQVNAAAKHVS